MRLFVLAFVLGTLALQHAAELPEPRPEWALGIAALLALRLVPGWPLPRVVLLLAAGFLLGHGLAASRAGERLADALPAAWEGRDIELVGLVASLPQSSARGLRFLFDVEVVRTPGANSPQRIALTWYAEAGRAYRLWIRGKAESNGWSNDSAHVQFSGSVNAAGGAVYRIGTSLSAEYNLESCSGCGLAGWGWEDNGWGSGVFGPEIFFASTGTQTIRIQSREDGLSIDQIVLSAESFLTASPGATKNDGVIHTKP